MGHHTAWVAPAPPVRRAAAETARAVLSVVMIAAAPAGRAEAAVLMRALGVCATSPAFAGLDAAGLRDLAAIVLRSLALRGPDGVIGDVEGLLTPAMAETALCLAIRAAWVGGQGGGAALDRLGALAARLGVTGPRLAEMLDILAVLDAAPR